MKKFLKNFPIETYVLFLPSLIFLLAMSVYVFFRKTGFVNQFFHGHFLAVILGNAVFPVTYIIFFVGIIEVLIMIKNQVKNTEIISFIKSACFLFGIFLISGAAISVAIQILFNIATTATIPTIATMLLIICSLNWGAQISKFTWQTDINLLL